MRSLRVSFALFLAAAGCSDDPSSPVLGETITLSASQAAALVGRIESFGSTDPTLAALADTVDVVIKGGAEARRVEITNDQGGSTFYAVALHMRNTMSSPASSTFNVIAFNDPTNPTLFVILGGWRSGSGSTPPGDVTGPIGGQATISLTGHLFSVSGNQVSSWHASQGQSSLLASVTNEPCSGFAGPGTCSKSTMTASFGVTGSVAGTGTTGQRTFSGTINQIPGITVSM